MNTSCYVKMNNNTPPLKTNKRKRDKLTLFNTYICRIHDNDKTICNIYECTGVKMNLFKERSVYCK
jgi:hypothetical protein